MIRRLWTRIHFNQSFAPSNRPISVVIDILIRGDTPMDAMPELDRALEFNPASCSVPASGGLDLR
jgi:hypothetical protein